MTLIAPGSTGCVYISFMSPALGHIPAAVTLPRLAGFYLRISQDHRPADRSGALWRRPAGCLQRGGTFVTRVRVLRPSTRAPDEHPAPREWAERVYNIQRWTEMPAGGHFAALEEAERLVEDICAFLRSLRRP
jgi:pimeloyl-ACP methyl ester carboxylesterase